MCKTFQCANPGNPATDINRKIRWAPRVLPGGQTIIPGSKSSEQSYFQVSNQQAPPVFGKQRWDRFENRVDRDFNQEQDANDLYDISRSRAYPRHPNTHPNTHPNPYINDFVPGTYVMRPPPRIPVNPRLSLGVDLRPHLSVAYNQLEMNSCASHAVAGAFEFLIRKAGQIYFTPSRLFIWYYARLNSQSPGNIYHRATDFNDGTSTEDALRVLEKGVCSEDLWPYIPSRSNRRTGRFPPDAMAATEPNEQARRFAIQNTATYEPINTENLHNNLIHCLDSGFPFIFSMSVRDWLYKKNLNASNGYQMQVPENPKSDKYADDWHAFLAVGYKPQNSLFIIRNSWGPNWADHGHFYMAYHYMRAYCTTFWTVRAKPIQGRRVYN
ncbi:hypothetical protein F5Y00DRAFT_268223 [Daldinia vernicosa]|uniref:uncharacterized protein n=1 Tax=Daldinia vernicosa TaxID=114800 RepID=UPI002008B9B2|nr:uncharacterized protein F5Y00DRAFT_268223 [Daldinia vernicosa]KAI0850839.1 hypothetical protein F5Y00DRAFT_268223 [Daldinia vernicosa]